LTHPDNNGQATLGRDDVCCGSRQKKSRNYRGAGVTAKVPYDSCNNSFASSRPNAAANGIVRDRARPQGLHSGLIQDSHRRPRRDFFRRKRPASSKRDTKDVKESCADSPDIPVNTTWLPELLVWQTGERIRYGGRRRLDAGNTIYDVQNRRKTGRINVSARLVVGQPTMVYIHDKEIVLIETRGLNEQFDVPGNRRSRCGNENHGECCFNSEKGERGRRPALP
jgi:hypothetical protein